MAAEQGALLLDRLQKPEPTEQQLKKMSFLEEKRVRIDVDCLRDNIVKMRDLYKERDAFINENDEIKENFWVRVFANAPNEIDQYIMTPDAAALSSTLMNLNVERFELNENGQGEPRSIRLTFEFCTGEENPFFENDKLVKELYWRKRYIQTADGKTKFWEGLVSEPVRIQWKEDMDLTKGLLDAACDLAEAEKKAGKDRKKLPELEKLKNKIVELETTAEQEDEEEDEEFPLSPAGASFFAFFGYRGNDVSAEESEVATKRSDERYAKLSRGESIDDAEEEDDVEFEDIEVFPDGEELAIAIADHLWPHALELFNRDEDMDIEEFEGDLDDEDDEDDEEETARPKKKTKV
ncbi:nucleosome assembly protein [Aspergillus coremiiformis]|uniref:Nucleosome assembly protein n=1 Tax=Aspergillus coremiiformis TaxID=138285 RepID=A0A5N6YSM5_9EURO|nr:nucleosome assembly protein [Aspergillus coremiiformis]